VIELLFLALVVGRLGLVLLPAGEAGSRRALDPIASLAPAWVLGIGVWRIGAVDGWWVVRSSHAGLAALAGVAVLALVLMAFGPAGLVPRHERHEPPAPLALRAASALTWIVVAAIAVPTDAPYLLLALLGAWLVEAGCERVGVGATRRRFVGLAALAVLAGWTMAELLPRPLLLTPTLSLSLGGWAFAAGWIRRADRRDLVLACVAFAASGAPLGAALALGVLVVASARPRLVLVPVLVALAALSIEWFFQGAPVRPSDLVLPGAAALVGLPLVFLARRRDTSRLRVSATSGAA
jgi:hypothetical protein